MVTNYPLFIIEGFLIDLAALLNTGQIMGFSRVEACGTEIDSD
jgi:hypothetical protein